MSFNSFKTSKYSKIYLHIATFPLFEFSLIQLSFSFKDLKDIDQYPMPSGYATVAIVH
jgi:hypothetical protein